MLNRCSQLEPRDILDATLRRPLQLEDLRISQPAASKQLIRCDNVVVWLHVPTSVPLGGFPLEGWSRVQDPEHSALCAICATQCCNAVGSNPRVRGPEGFSDQNQRSWDRGLRSETCSTLDEASLQQFGRTRQEVRK